MAERMNILSEDRHDRTVERSFVKDAISAIVLGAVAPALLLAVSRISVYSMAVSIIGLIAITVVGSIWIIKGMHATNGKALIGAGLLIIGTFGLFADIATWQGNTSLVLISMILFFILYFVGNMIILMSIIGTRDRH